MGTVRDTLTRLARDPKIRKVVVTLIVTVLQLVILRRPPAKPG